MERLILGENQYYSLDCYETKLNNNVLVVGTTGAGKTRGVVIPNILEASGSYVISDPKGSLYDHYGDYLRSKGYEVCLLDFTEPKKSAHYNFFEYIRSTLDINKMANMIIKGDGPAINADPFWDDSAELLMESLIAYVHETCSKEEQTLASIVKLMEAMNISGDYEINDSVVDIIMKDLEEKNKDSYALRQYRKFRVAASRTLRSIMITLNSKISNFDTPEIREMTAYDDIDIGSLGFKKRAVFVVVSDNDRSLDSLVNLFFTQAMNELCYVADKKCEENRLPVPVRFILDDFATNCKINEFPRMISSIRSRGISAMLMIQSEGQLETGYGHDWKTIISNCDSYVYLGANDVDTAQAVARRCDVPLKKILAMPVGTNWIFRRGQEPINGKIIDLDEYLANSEKTKEGHNGSDKRRKPHTR